MNNNLSDNSKKKWKIPVLWSYILGGVLIYIVIYPFMRKLSTSNEAQNSLIGTLLSLAAIYFGKFCSQLLSINRKQIPPRWFVIGIIVLVCLVSWLFLIGQFPIKEKTALNLMLFGVPFLAASMLLGGILHLIRTTVENNLHEAQITATQSRTELSLLQSQLSPHFLFNTLNNMYGISITQHEKIPPLLLKLSELLRYSLYEAKDIYVPIRNEIEYLNNYVEFERLRMGDRLQLRTAIENITDNSLKIAPMLLIVFVENAFKHSKNTTDEKVFVEMELRLWGKYLQFSIRNSGNSGEAKDPASRKMKDGEYFTINTDESAIGSDKETGSQKNSGLGLANVQKRLDLLYPNAYDLNIEVLKDEFIVMLQIKIS